MLYKQCPKCDNLMAWHKLTCPQCEHRAISLSTIKKYIENSRLRLAMLCITLILFVGLGWFVRIETGSRWPLFLVFFLVAPFVPWILKLAYGHATKQEDNNHSEND